MFFFSKVNLSQLKSIKGHRTYPAFIHFLTSATLLALYIATFSMRALLYSFNNPYGVVGHIIAFRIELFFAMLMKFQDEITPIHELILSAYGIVIALVVGPFAGYHFYLVTCVVTRPDIRKLS